MKPFLGLLTFQMSYQVTPKKIVDFLEAKGEAERYNAVFAAPEAVRAAAVQLTRRDYADFRAYAGEMYALAKAAVAEGAQVAVFPEYVGLTALTMVPGWNKLLHWIFRGTPPQGMLCVSPPDPARLASAVEAFDGFLDEIYTTTFSTIARLLHIYIVAGSTLVREGDRLLNRCVIFAPDGSIAGTQDKVCAVGLDRALCISGSDLVEPIDTPMGPLGVVLGSDAYYFECFKILREKGARLIAVPGIGTGVTRDLLRCRANENGVYLLFSCYANAQGAAEPVRAGVFAPLMSTPERDGIVAAPQDARACVICARTNLQRLLPPIDEGDRNAAFLTGDYLYSYRYCGTLPLVDPK